MPEGAEIAMTHLSSTQPAAPYSEPRRSRVLAARYPAHTGAFRLYGPGVSQSLVALYRQLRTERGGVAPVLLESDVPAWLVLGYREAHFVASHGELFDRDSARWNAWDLVPPEWPLLPAVGKADSVMWVSGAEHARRSGAIHDVLTEVNLFDLRSQCARIADELVDRFADTGEAELMYQYAHVLPARAIAGILGIPAHETAAVVLDLVRILDQGPDALDAHGRISALLGRLVAQRRSAPGRDVISRLVAHPAALTDEEAIQDIFVLVGAGQQPTAYWIGNTLRLLLSDDRFATTLAGGRRSVGQAMAEVLWEDPPVANFTGRWAVRSASLGAQRIQAGDMLVLGVAAANADPTIRPDACAGTAGNQAHLAFGLGEHRCPMPAEDLAEAIAETAVEVLLDRLPDITLAIPTRDLVWTPAVWVRGLTALPTTFTAV
ncbi:MULTISPECIES: cytochrome P450 [unclassified Frankia]|uniref:cytochrome P450 n=1 Tax=unclassified Frankia TaxID=2632575 RepID=UPI001EE3CF53|nr:MULTISPECIES: cytochrome P450 [unclassified Frankia]